MENGCTEAHMSKRIVAFALGILIGVLLRAALIPQVRDVPPAALSADARCAAHVVKMPCLFDGR